MTGPDPGRPLLVFDGDCSFCTTTAMLAKKWLALPHVEPWQFLDLAPLGLDAEQCQESVQWVDADGAVAPGELAFIAALRYGGGVWKVFGAIMNLPGVRQLAGVIYRVIARYRHRMPGGTAACKLPRP